MIDLFGRQSRAVIVDLAHHRTRFPPQPYAPAPSAVPDGVGQKLVDRDHEIVPAVTAEPGRPGGGRDRVPQRGDPALVEVLGQQQFGDVCRR
jgi:hypothetical protein